MKVLTFSDSDFEAACSFAQSIVLVVEPTIPIMVDQCASLPDAPGMVGSVAYHEILALPE